jgi:DnaJ-domain-containing protein 1
MSFNQLEIEALLSVSAFSLFNLAPSLDIDLSALKKTYWSLQKKVHPDQQDLSLDVLQQASARVNQSYVMLQAQETRLALFLEAYGLERPQAVSLPKDFLAQQWHWREAMDAAQTIPELKQIQEQVEKAREQLWSQAKAQACTLSQSQSTSAAIAPIGMDMWSIVDALTYLKKLHQSILASFNKPVSSDILTLG